MLRETWAVAKGRGGGETGGRVLRLGLCCVGGRWAVGGGWRAGMGTCKGVGDRCAGTVWRAGTGRLGFFFLVAFDASLGTEPQFLDWIKVSDFYSCRLRGVKSVKRSHNWAGELG